VFDVENGILLLEPMTDMESDSLAREGDYLIARCGGGAAILVLKYVDGDEELEE
jgi:hypothetical protein